MTLEWVAFQWAHVLEGNFGNSIVLVTCFISGGCIRKNMEVEQVFEWNEAQKILISVDLVAAAKQHLQFLAAVDRNRYLYDGPGLKRAIYR